MVLHALSLFFNFINSTPYHLGRKEPSSPTQELRGWVNQVTQLILHKNYVICIRDSKYWKQTSPNVWGCYSRIPFLTCLKSKQRIFNNFFQINRLPSSSGPWRFATKKFAACVDLTTTTLKCWTTASPRRKIWAIILINTSPQSSWKDIFQIKCPISTYFEVWLYIICHITFNS